MRTFETINSEQILLYYLLKRGSIPVKFIIVGSFISERVLIDYSVGKNIENERNRTPVSSSVDDDLL